MQILDMLADLKRWDVDDYYDPDATTGTVYSRWGVSCVLMAYGILRGIKAAPVSWEGNQKKKKTCLYSWTLSSQPFTDLFWYFLLTLSTEFFPTSSRLARDLRGKRL